VAITGESDFLAALEGRFHRRHAFLDVAWMFSSTTMASSTTRPMDSTTPSKVSVLIEKPSTLRKVKWPMTDTGIRHGGNQGRARAAQEHKDHQHHEDQRLDHGFVDGLESILR